MPQRGGRGRKVVADLRAAVPDIVVYVYDNLSTDRTVERGPRGRRGRAARAAKGKGNVVAAPSPTSTPTST